MLYFSCRLLQENPCSLESTCLLNSISPGVEAPDMSPGRSVDDFGGAAPTRLARHSTGDEESYDQQLTMRYHNFDRIPKFCGVWKKLTPVTKDRWLRTLLHAYVDETTKRGQMRSPVDD